MTRVQHLAAMAAIAVSYERSVGYPPDVLIAQWAIESNWGKRPSGKNNLFGMTFNPSRHKSFSWVPTWEELTQDGIDRLPLDERNRIRSVVPMSNRPGYFRVELDRKFADYDTAEESIADKVGLSGGNMTSSMRACGAIGCVTNGPSRDVHEIRPMNFQYLTRGVCAGHGPQAVHAVQVPVSISGMDVAPGEIIHMDENGAVKFPADRLEDVVRSAKALLAEEDERVGQVLKVKGIAAVKAIMAGHQYVKK